MSIEELCGALQCRFEIEEAVCRTEVIAFVDQLVAKGLLERTSR